VVDTLPQFAHIRGDGENSSGEALAAIEPLQAATEEGMAVVVVRHDRKSGGEVGESSRGSSAFAGAVDIIISIRRHTGNGAPTLRVLHALSRFDETPDKLVIDLTPGGYVAMGTEEAVAVDRGKAAILDVVSTSEEEALSLDDFVDKGVVKRSTGQTVLKELAADGDLVRTGEGKRGHPFRYYLKTIPAATQGALAERNRKMVSSQKVGYKPVSTPTTTMRAKFDGRNASPREGSGAGH